MSKEESKRQEVPPKKAVDDLVIELQCTLRELYNGCMKTISYKKEKLLHYSGRKTENITCEKDIEIRPGYYHKQEVRFPGEGHDAVGKHSGDLVVRIIQTPMEDFQRHGDHLVYTKHISLEDSMIPESFQVTTLDDRILSISINETISQQTATVVKGEGMPVLDQSNYLGEIGKSDIEC